MNEEVWEVPKDPSVLRNNKSIRKNTSTGDLSKGTLDYFLVKDPKFSKIYLLPKIQIQVRGTTIGTKFAPLCYSVYGRGKRSQCF